MVVKLGVATGLAMVVLLRPDAGLQIKFVPELTLSTAESPQKIVVAVAVTVALPPALKCATMLSDLIKLMYTALSRILGSGV